MSRFSLYYFKELICTKRKWRIAISLLVEPVRTVYGYLKQILFETGCILCSSLEVDVALKGADKSTTF